jgi:hypothetical protein
MIGGIKKGDTMNTHGSYIGFGELPDKDELFEALINDPPEIRWRVVRTLLRIEDPQHLAAVQGHFMNRLRAIETPPAQDVVSRVQMTMNAIQRPVRVRGYVLVKGKGAYTTDEWEKAGHDIDKLAFVWAFLNKLHPAIGRGKNGVILADSRVETGMKARTALTDNDAAGVDFLATKPFYTQSFTFRFASVFRTTYTFFMSHGKFSLLIIQQWFPPEFE